MSALIRRLIKPFLLRFFPQHVLSTLACEWHLYSVRCQLPSLRLRYAKSHGLLVNFGAGSSGKDGWVNVDGFQQPNINCLLDGRAPMPFPDGSVKGIFSEHFFEHLRYPDDALFFLKECFRVMSPGGVLRLIVPDAELYLLGYGQAGWGKLAEIRPLDAERNDPYGRSYRTRMELINEVFRQGDEHKFAYDYETLEILLNRAGFSRVVRSSFGGSLESELALDLAHRQNESLYVEAVR